MVNCDHSTSIRVRMQNLFSPIAHSLVSALLSSHRIWYSQCALVALNTPEVMVPVCPFQKFHSLPQFPSTRPPAPTKHGEQGDRWACVAPPVISIAFEESESTCPLERRDWRAGWLGVGLGWVELWLIRLLWLMVLLPPLS